MGLHNGEQGTWLQTRLPRAFTPSEKIRPWLVYDLLEHTVVGQVLTDPKMLEPIYTWLKDPCVATRQNCRNFLLDSTIGPQPYGHIQGNVFDNLYYLLDINLCLVQEIAGRCLGYAVHSIGEGTAVHALANTARRQSLLCSLTPHLPPVSTMFMR